MEKSQKRKEGPMVLPRAFALLRLLAENPEGLNLSDLATSLDVPKSSLSATLKALTEQEFLERKSTLYMLGSAAYGLASAILAGRTLTQIARPFMRKTMEKTGETVLLAELGPGGEYSSYIDFLESGKSVRFAVSIGTQRPLYASAAGKALLAFMPEALQVSYLDKVKFEKRTDSTIVNRAKLERELEKIRQTGISITLGEYSTDAAGFAAPIMNSEGLLVGAVAIGAPISRGLRDKELYIEAAMEAGASISKVLGYRHET